MESQIQAAIIKRLRSQGWLVNKLIACSQPGTPDLIIHRKGRTVYIEVKQPNLKPSPLQVYRMTELIAEGIPCIITSNTDECLKRLEEIILRSAYPL